MQNSHKPNLFRDLSKEEKKRFYHEELFDGNRIMKKYIILICGLIIVCESVKLGIVLLNDFNEADLFDTLLVPGLTGFALFINFLSRLNIFESKLKSSKVHALRITLLCVANVLFCSGLFINVRSFLQMALEYNTPSAWFDSVYYVCKSVYVIILDTMLFPYWQMRITPPIAYFLGVFISYLDSGLPRIELAWVELITSIIYVLCLFITAEWFRWKLFIKKCEGDDWRIINEYILNRVHNAIVVVDPEGKVIYSNKEFQNMAKNDIQGFFGKIKDLKKREEDYKGNDIEMSSQRLSPKGLGEESKLGFLVGARPSKIFQKGCTEIIKDINQLISLAIESIQMGFLMDGDVSTFDGKLVEEENDKKQLKSYEVSVSPMGSYNKIILIFHDISHYTRLVALESNNIYKDKLLASVSHELRTPLNGNLALVEATLNHRDVPQTVKEELILPAYNSGKLLAYLINDILDYSQIKAEKLRMIFKNMSIKKTLLNCYHLMEIQAKLKGLELVLSLSDNFPESFVTDHDRVTQIILNLLSNALKFTIRGRVILKGERKGLNKIELSVEDTGIGIKQENIPKLFQEFTKIEEEGGEKNLNSKGVGLGLTISDQLARMLGPKDFSGIFVESIYGKGSCFSLILESKEENKKIWHSSQRLISNTLEIPERIIFDCSLEDNQSSIQNIDEHCNLSPDNRSNIASRSLAPWFKSMSSQPQITSQTKRPLRTSLMTDSVLIPSKKGAILVVDDEPFNILALRSLLRGAEYIVESASNGKEAIDKVLEKEKNGENLKYKLIFMDCQMPIMDGYKATVELCKLMEKRIEKIPIIGCTAFTSKSQTENCFRCGMKDVMHKPLSKKKVLEIVKTYIAD